jgi:hypothetical protein
MPRRKGRFDGYRVNCEVVPRLPARVVTECLSDPRRIPYLLIWRHRFSGVLKEVVRLAPLYPEYDPAAIGWIEVKRYDGTTAGIRSSRDGRGSLLICNFCRKARRVLYGWKTNEELRNVSQALWPCRVCAGLSYASEGGSLIIRSRCYALRPLSGWIPKPRPQPWEPLVFTSPSAAAYASLATFGG